MTTHDTYEFGYVTADHGSNPNPKKVAVVSFPSWSRQYSALSSGYSAGLEAKKSGDESPAETRFIASAPNFPPFFGTTLPVRTLMQRRSHQIPQEGQQKADMFRVLYFYYGIK